MLYKKPTLLKDYIKEWGISHWDEEYIIKVAGDIKTNISLYGRPVSKHIECTYKEFFKDYKSKGYYIFNRSKEILKSFTKDIIIPDKFNSLAFNQYIFYAGNKGTGALPHKHSIAFNLLVYGKKKWILFDASKNNKLGYKLQDKYYLDYPYRENTTSTEWYDKEYNTSLQEYKDAGGEVIEFIQNSGDVVYIPSQWSHTIINLEECMGITLTPNYMRIT